MDGVKIIWQVIAHGAPTPGYTTMYTACPLRYIPLLGPFFCVRHTTLWLEKRRKWKSDEKKNDFTRRNGLLLLVGWLVLAYVLLKTS